MYISIAHGADRSGAARGLRPNGRTSAATLAALSVLATGGVVLATPGVAHAAPAEAVQDGQSIVVRPAIVGPVVPPTDAPARGTRVTLTVDKATILDGQSIVFNGTLTLRKKGTPLTNQALRLEANTGGEWKTVASALAAADGTVTFTVKPTTSTKYRLAYAGVQTLRASVSVEQVITVKKPLPPPPPPTRSVAAPSRSSSSAGLAIGANGNPGSATGQAIVAAAAAQSGKPYSYGSAGPNAFDCSGLVKYVFAQFGISLPHNAHAQMSYGRPVSAAEAAPGDLVFFLDGGYAYHVGIYAGGNTMYDAPNSGSTVGKHTIWTSNVVFRRLV
ncbi:MAG: C40 family peptidase [Dactylosporangium sp.]|nr:C40 family peptidase [Dactylosporangium sp.]